MQFKFPEPKNGKIFYVLLSLVLVSASFPIIFLILRNNDTKLQSTNLIFKNNGLPRVVIVIGTRPEGIKCAPLISKLRSNAFKDKFEVIVLSTGQHREMLSQTLAAFDQQPDIDLNLMTTNQELGSFFDIAFAKLTNEFIKLRKISLVVVQGDTTTALAAALAAAHQRIPVAHVEAGLRSYNMENPYPEEMNRKVIDSISRLMLAPTEFSKEALIREGSCADHVFVTGNTGIDAFFSLQKRLPNSFPSFFEDIKQFRQRSLDSKKVVILVTMHRRENVVHMKEMCSAIKTIMEKNRGKVMAILPVHPNPNVRSVVLEVLKPVEDIQIVDPISYEIFPHLLTQADIIMTDSGGIQEEAASIGKPVILMRETTERPEGVYLGTIQQIGVKYNDIINAVEKVLESLKEGSNKFNKLHLFGDGQASERIAMVFEQYLYGHEVENPNCSTIAKQNSIANAIYSHDQFKNNAIGPEPTNKEQLLLPIIPTTKVLDPYQTRKERLTDRTRTRQQLTMPQIFQLPSKYSISKKDSDEFSVTAVLGFYKRTGLTKRWFESIAQQSHPPKVVWIVFFSSPVHLELEKEIEESKSILTSKNITVLVNKGEMQLKYFGRFQLALQTTTKYVVVFDDDCLPQPRFFEAALHTINTEQYRGILGTKGTPFAEDNFFGPVSRSDKIIEVDVVGGSWFMEREWVKLMFREKMFTWATGEDWDLCVNSRKYANIRSFVMPVDPNDSTTHSFSTDYMDISNKGDTTGRVSGTSEARGYLRTNHNKRGDRHMNSYLKGKAILLFVENQKDALFLVTSFHNLNIGGIEVGISVHNAPESGIDVNELSKIHTLRSLNDFMVGREYDSPLTPVSMAAETMYHFDIAIQQTQSTALMVVGSSASTTTMAVVTAAQLTKVPIINFIIQNQTTNQDYSDTIRSSATINIIVNSDGKMDEKEHSKLLKVMKELY